MNRFCPCTIVPLTLGFALVVSLGCGNRPETAELKKPRKQSNDAAPAKAAEPVKTGDGVIKGKVVFGGDPPTCMTAQLIKDTAGCLAPPNLEWQNCPTMKWQLGKDKGVANAVVYLLLDDAHYFQLNDAQKKRSDDVIVDQEFCAFDPHVSAINPTYYEGSERLRTGQKLIIKNSAVMPHNSKLKGNGDDNPAEQGGVIPPKKSDTFDKLNGQSTPLTVNCDVHAWMSAVIWSFDHPYYARTKEDGAFEIKNVPIGSKLKVVFWHEATQKFRQEDVTLTAEANTKDYGAVTVSPP